MSESKPHIYSLPASATGTNQIMYGQISLRAAAENVVKLVKEGQRVGNQNFPRVYNDEKHIGFSDIKPPYFEMPLTKDGPPFDGSQAVEADFIIIGSIDREYSSAVYCATITYVEGIVGPGASFVPAETAVAKSGEEDVPPGDRDVLKVGEV